MSDKGSNSSWCPRAEEGRLVWLGESGGPSTGSWDLQGGGNHKHVRHMPLWDKIEKHGPSGSAWSRVFTGSMARNKAGMTATLDLASSRGKWRFSAGNRYHHKFQNSVLTSLVKQHRGYIGSRDLWERVTVIDSETTWKCTAEFTRVQGYMISIDLSSQELEPP